MASDHVGLQTMTIRENVTDRKEFERRFKSIATNAFPKSIWTGCACLNGNSAAPGTLMSSW